MAHREPARVGNRPRGTRAPAFGWWVGLLVGAKTLDPVTTVVGLEHSSRIQEQNVLVTALIDSYGRVPSLLAVTLATTLVIVAVTETGVVLGRRLEPDGRDRTRLVRLVGYGLPALWYVGVAVYNLSVIAAA